MTRIMTRIGTTTKRSRFFTLAIILTLTAGTPLLAQRGRGAPQLPGQSRVPPDRFPGFPPNAGVGQPDTAGRPDSLPDAANPRGGDAPGDEVHGQQPDLTPTPPSATDQLSRTPELAGRLAGMLGVDSLTTEPDGFRNLGLFVAAVQVSSHVEGTTFAGLKDNMLNGDMSLGEAIQEETGMSEDDANDAAQEASDEADEIIEENS